MSPSSVTKSCRKATCQLNERKVSVVDTPGIFDTVLTETELKSEIERCISLSVPGPHIFLLVIRLDARFTQEEKNAIRWIEDNFGEAASKYTLVLFTRGDEVRGMSPEDYVRQSPELWEFIRGCTAGFIVFDNTWIKNGTQVADLFEKIDEMVHSNGNHYTSSMYDEVQKQMNREEWKSKIGDTMDKAGDQLLMASVVTAVVNNPLVGGPVLSMATLAMLAGAGISKAVGWWMKPKTTDRSIHNHIE